MRNKAADLSPRDVVTALGLLTRLPVRGDMGRGAAAAWAFPLAGLVVGGLAAFAVWLALAMGVPVAVAAGIGLAAQALLTGAMHEDGLADTCDGFWGGWSRARRLAIMKDSQIGTYGVMGLLLVTLGRWSALALLLDAGWLWAPMLAAAVVSRVPMVWIMAFLRNARGTGLSQSVGRPDVALAGIATAIGLVVLVLSGMPVIVPALLLTLGTIGLAVLAQARIGGQTGDVLGAAQQLAEVLLLVIFASALA